MPGDILGTSWDQCRRMVQYSFTSRKPEGSLGRTAQVGHLVSHTAPELWTNVSTIGQYYILAKLASTSTSNPLLQILCPRSCSGSIMCYGNVHYYHHTWRLKWHKISLSPPPPPPPHMSIWINSKINYPGTPSVFNRSSLEVTSRLTDSVLRHDAVYNTGDLS